MYRIFCESFKRYIELNREGDFENDPRLKIIKPVGIIADVKKFLTLQKGDMLKIETENLISEIGKNTDRFRSFKAFSWELDGYGFDRASHPIFQKAVIEEQLKLINLLLSGHYWTIDVPQ